MDVLQFRRALSRNIAVSPSVGAKSSKPILLIGEDDQNIRDLVIAAAWQTGEYSEIRDAPDGNVALKVVRETLRTKPPEGILLVLSDINMPRMDGLELLRELKKDPETRDVPVAIMTS